MRPTMGSEPFPTRTMKKRSRVVVLLLLVILGATNPGVDLHKTKIDERYRSDNPITGFLGMGKLVGSSVNYHNYIVFSTTTIDQALISIGFSGQVFVRSLDIR